MNLDSTVKELLKIAKEKQKEEPKKVEEKKMTTSCEEAKKLANLCQYAWENFDQILPQGALKMAEEKMKTMEAPRMNGRIHRDDMGHTPDDPSKEKGEVMDGMKVKAQLPRAKGQADLLNKSAQRVLSKLALEGAMKTQDSKQAPTHFAGEDKSGFGNENRKLVTSESKAQSFTKRDAKREYIKDQVGKLFSHVDPEKDTVVGQSFNHGTNTSKLAGSKFAGLETLKKMKNLVKEEKKDEKVEEQLDPGIHKKVEKIEATKKLAGILADKNHPMYTKVASILKRASDLVQGQSPMPTQPQPDPTQAQGMPGQKLPGCTCMQGMDGKPLCPICTIAAKIQQEKMQGGQMSGAEVQGQTSGVQGGMQ
jgi:hypothetical protein